MRKVYRWLRMSRLNEILLVRGTTFSSLSTLRSPFKSRCRRGQRHRHGIATCSFWHHAFRSLCQGGRIESQPVKVWTFGMIRCHRIVLPGTRIRLLWLWDLAEGPGFSKMLRILMDFVNLPLTLWPALQVFKVFLQINLSMPVRLLSVLMPDRLLSYRGSRAEQWWFKWDEDTKIRRCHSCHWWFRHRFWGAKACIVRLLALKQFACAIFCAKSRAISVLHRELIWKPIDQWAFQQKRLKCFVLRRGKDFRSRMWQLMTSGYKMIQVSKTNTNDNTWNSWHLLVRLAVTWVFGYFQMSSSLQRTFICQVRFVPQSSRLMAALYWQASSAQKGSKNHFKKLWNQSILAKCYCFFYSEFNSKAMQEMLP